MRIHELEGNTYGVIIKKWGEVKQGDLLLYNLNFEGVRVYEFIEDEGYGVRVKDEQFGSAILSYSQCYGLLVATSDETLLAKYPQLKAISNENL